MMEAGWWRLILILNTGMTTQLIENTEWGKLETEMDTEY